MTDIQPLDINIIINTIKHISNIANAPDISHENTKKTLNLLAQYINLIHSVFNNKYMLTPLKTEDTQQNQSSGSIEKTNDKIKQSDDSTDTTKINYKTNDKQQIQSEDTVKTKIDDANTTTTTNTTNDESDNMDKVIKKIIEKKTNKDECESTKEKNNVIGELLSTLQTLQGVLIEQYVKK